MEFCSYSQSEVDSDALVEPVQYSVECVGLSEAGDLCIQYHTIKDGEIHHIQNTFSAKETALIFDWIKRHKKLSKKAQKP